MKIVDGKFPHVKWVELNSDGVLHEVAVLREDPTNGDMYFINLAGLDQIDKQRLVRIITQKNAATLPLWELMQYHTLGNGVNALNYFHQLVKVVTPSGKVMDPNAARRGMANAVRKVSDLEPAAEDVAEDAAPKVVRKRAVKAKAE